MAMFLIFLVLLIVLAFAATRWGFVDLPAISTREPALGGVRRGGGSGEPWRSANSRSHRLVGKKFSGGNPGLILEKMPLQ